MRLFHADGGFSAWTGSLPGDGGLGKGVAEALAWGEGAPEGFGGLQIAVACSCLTLGVGGDRGAVFTAEGAGAAGCLLPCSCFTEERGAALGFAFLVGLSPAGTACSSSLDITSIEQLLSNDRAVTKDLQGTGSQ